MAEIPTHIPQFCLMTDVFGGVVRYTYGRRGPKGSSAKTWVKKSGSVTSKGSKRSRSSAGSKNSGSSGGYVVISEGNGDRMVRWWTSKVDEWDCERQDLISKVETLEALNSALQRQLDQAQQPKFVTTSDSDSGAAVAAPVAAPVGTIVQPTPAAYSASAQIVIREKDEVIARLAQELRNEAKAHADLKLLMMQHHF